MTATGGPEPRGRELVIGAPEAAGTVLAAIVIILVAVVIGSNRVGTADVSPSASASASPTPTATASAVVAVDSPGPNVEPTASPSLETTTAPFQSSARTVLDLADRLAGYRADLIALLDDEASGGGDLAPVIRDVRLLLPYADAAVDALAADDAPRQLVVDLRAPLEEAQAIALEMTGLALHEEGGYRRGARDLANALEPLAIAADELAEAAGIERP